MKTLILLILSLVFISCEESTQSADVKDGIRDNPQPVNNILPHVNIELLEGTYKSECTLENGKYFVYHLDVDGYEVEVLKTEGTNSNCEGMRSATIAKFDINGDVLEFVETEYVFLSGGSYICGQSHMTSGDYFNIDGIGCSESFENKENIVGLSDDDDFTINGIEFNKI